MQKYTGNDSSRVAIYYYYYFPNLSPPPSQIEELASENRRLSESLSETRSRLTRREEEAAGDREEMGRLEGALFRAHSEVSDGLAICFT